MSLPYPSFVAGGTIEPCRFVKAGTANHTVLQADAAAVCLGVSGEDAELAPTAASVATAHATSGDPVTVHPPGAICLLQMGSGGCTRFLPVKSDANGKGVIASSTNPAFFRPFSTGAADEYVLGMVLEGYVTP